MTKNDAGFDAALKFVKRWEGDWVDDPHDRGGVTKWGITIRTLIAKALDLNNDGVVDRRDIRDMTVWQARNIYFTDYWIAAVCPSLPTSLALLQFDCAVNQGVGRAARILQKSVGVKVDGIIGKKTLAAVGAAYKRDPRKLLGEYSARRVRHYSSLAQVTRYGLGWFRRLFDAHAEALEIWRSR